MPRSAAVRVFDLLLGFLLRPRVKRILGAERRDALLDLLMHPFARRAIIGEARMLLTLPAALAARLRTPKGEAFACHRGTYELGFALALLPALLAEATIVHLLLPAGWFWAHVGLAALHLYAAVMLLSWAVATRTSPHRVREGWLELRGGRLYRADVAAGAVAGAEVRRRRDGQRTGLDVDWDVPRLAVAGRTDVLLRFTHPVVLVRPLADPLSVTSLEVAVDDPEPFVAAIAAAAHAVPAAPTRPAPLAWLGPVDLADALAT